MIIIIIIIDITEYVVTYQNMSKYIELETEIGKMWNVEARTIHVLITVLEIIAKGADTYVSDTMKPQKGNNSESSAHRNCSSLN